MIPVRADWGNAELAVDTYGVDLSQFVTRRLGVGIGGPY